ncbi:MAG: hypothetical protein K2Y05_11150 [Hyphomicrobiaceae bacterium]|nr:hypothetical protein [Hyphomicrobiaceae bacterium]
MRRGRLKPASRFAVEAQVDGLDHAGGPASAPPATQPSTKTIDLGSKADELAIKRPDLRESIATQVLTLFRYSLLGTLAFAAVILATDLFFIWTNVIAPADRLMTERVLITLIGATVVQVGAALAAIVFAVFKTPPPSDD